LDHVNVIMDQMDIQFVELCKVINNTPIILKNFKFFIMQLNIDILQDNINIHANFLNNLCNCKFISK